MAVDTCKIRGVLQLAKLVLQLPFIATPSASDGDAACTDIKSVAEGLIACIRQGRTCTTHCADLATTLYVKWCDYTAHRDRATARALEGCYQKFLACDAAHEASHVASRAVPSIVRRYAEANVAASLGLALHNALAVAFLPEVGSSLEVRESSRALDNADDVIGMHQKCTNMVTAAESEFTLGELVYGFLSRERIYREVLIVAVEVACMRHQSPSGGAWIPANRPDWHGLARCYGAVWCKGDLMDGARHSVSDRDGRRLQASILRVMSSALTANEYTDFTRVFASHFAEPGVSELGVLSNVVVKCFNSIGETLAVLHHRCFCIGSALQHLTFAPIRMLDILISQCDEILAFKICQREHVQIAIIAAKQKMLAEHARRSSVDVAAMQPEASVDMAHVAALIEHVADAEGEGEGEGDGYSMWLVNTLGETTGECVICYTDFTVDEGGPNSVAFLDCAPEVEVPHHMCAACSLKMLNGTGTLKCPFCNKGDAVPFAPRQFFDVFVDHRG